jgi:hypothetical protein
MMELINGGKWLDTNENPIHAHGGHILYYQGYYYWYGEDRRDQYYVSCYRSQDLFTWEFRKHILTTASQTSKIRIRTKIQLTREDGGKVNLERPKVLFNEKTKQFVLWIHFENGTNYHDAACAIATCDTPDGDFVYHGHFNPYGYMSRDCTLYQDDDGTAYFISAARDNADLHVYRLQDDYLNTEKLVAQLWQGEYREAPAVIKKHQKYYMCSSFCTGWAPNQGKFAVADSMEGPWSVLDNFGDETTYDSQPAFILTTHDGQYLYYGDRWDAEDYFNSSYVLLPLEVSEDKMSIDFYRKAVLIDQGNIEFTND